MATTESTAGGDDAFPAVDVSRELNRGVPEQFPVDPISSKVSTAKQLKEEAEAVARAKAAMEAEKRDQLNSTLMSVLVVSGVVVAAVGVAFFVTKKLKQT